MTAPADIQGRTPGPWHIVHPVVGAPPIIVDSHGHVIASLYPHAKSSKADANAAFIVRCANSHDALVEALTVALRTIAHEMWLHEEDKPSQATQDVMDGIRAALRAARGEG